MNARCFGCRQPARLYRDMEDAEGKGYCTKCWAGFYGAPPRSNHPVGRGVPHVPGPDAYNGAPFTSAAQEMIAASYREKQAEPQYYAVGYSPQARNSILRMDIFFTCLVLLGCLLALLTPWVGSRTLGDLRSTGDVPRCARATTAFLAILFLNYLVFILFRGWAPHLVNFSESWTFSRVLQVVLGPCTVWSILCFVFSILSVRAYQMRRYNAGFWLALVVCLAIPLHFVLRRSFLKSIEAYADRLEW
ncbi:hypothetical protein DIPPA_16022 [Diplonema papillatum]|nr:hypothetical protein DIPPA_16022 [Diplonema papillatum]